MVLKRFLSMSLLVTLTLLFVAFPCSAHPGRTDSNGGHYDHDTGEYHYHNDGSPQNTPQYESGSSCSNEDDTVTTKSFAAWSKEKNKYSASGLDHNYSNNTEKEDEGSSSGYIAYIVISIIAFIFLISAVLIYRSNSKDYERLCNRLKSDISELKEKQKLLEDENNKAEEEIKLLQNKLKTEKKYEGETVAKLIGIPTDSVVGDDNLPKEENATQYWGEKYTFFVSWKGNKYHKQSCRHAKTAIPVNAYNLRTRDCHPCYSCNPILPDMKWVDRHFEIKALKEKYDEENNPYLKINYRNETKLPDISTLKIK